MVIKLEMYGVERMAGKTERCTLGSREDGFMLFYFQLFRRETCGIKARIALVFFPEDE